VLRNVFSQQAADGVWLALGIEEVADMIDLPGAGTEADITRL
jgi:hypothetical protein